MRKFVILKQLKVEAPECDDDHVFEDVALKIHYLPLRCSENDESAVMSYICECKPKPGALSMEKCSKLGVPKGPLLGKLKNGETITLENGSTVKPNDVREPDDPGPIFLVIDIPSIDYLGSLRKNGKFEDYLRKSHLDRKDLIIHFTPMPIINTNEYNAFMNSFPSHTQHLLVNEHNKFSGFIAAHRMQWQLHQLNEFIFPILKEALPLQEDESGNCTKKIKLSDNSPKTNEENELKKFENASPMTCFQLRPRKFVDRSFEFKSSPSEFVKEIIDIEGMPEVLEALKTDRKRLSRTERNKEYPRIVFLGTGSCIPNKTRNVSSILVFTSEETCILLDCGEGTLGQILRFYGDEAEDVIKKIKAIFISHLHADHHIGLFGIIQMKQSLCPGETESIILMAPSDMKPWMMFYDSEVEPVMSSVEFIANHTLIDDGLSDEKTAYLGLSSLRQCFVVHCPNAFGITMTINNAEPFKLTYSGDTKPCDSLIEIGANSSLLIHEATMEDELFEDALAKMHSTVSQAIEQGRKMNAKYTLLTHFSQRYAKIPRMEEHLIANVGIAFNNMEVVASDLDHLHTLYPAMKKMFPDHWDDMEQKSIKRAHKKAIEKLETD